jgi:hypothetical protein
VQHFSALARGIASVIFTGVVIPIAVHFIEEQPGETANVVLKFLIYLGEQTWLRVAALLLGGFVAGLWVDWLLRKLDSSRADERKALGTEMVELGNYLEQLRFPMQKSASIRSCFATAQKLGIWVPDERVFQLHPPRAYHEVSNYLRNVGTTLRDGNFPEAKRDAKKSKTAFEKAYAQHSLSSK